MRTMLTITAMLVLGLSGSADRAFVLVLLAFGVVALLIRRGAFTPRR